uniref:Uncharacterized protein n=1 Tax=Anopheles atroparvus TaxID=41427 RepID=A0AAG5DAF9_ANOAO
MFTVNSNMAMEQRQMYNKAYVDALRTNESETQRWNAYRQEHVDLKGNLRMYQKSPRTDILIPMGTKALLPGQLYHTGEVLVSHGGGYFSECSSDQAQTIADRRIRLADGMLEKYERERTLYSDKLEVPFINEAFATAEGGREIIEPYDEQAEERWRVEHRRRVRESKQREAVERANRDLDDKALIEKMEEMELLEELENEIDQLEMPEDDDQLGRLMRGEIRLNSKQRTAHSRENETKPAAGDGGRLERIKEGATIPQQSNTTTDVEEHEPSSEEEIVTTDDENSVGEHDEEDISPEFSQLLNETKNLSKEEKIKIFQAKLKDVRQRLYQNSISIAEKVDLYQLYEELEESLDFLRPAEEANATVDDEEKGSRKEVAFKDEADMGQKKQSRKISFAEHDDIKLIDGRHGPVITENNLFSSTGKTLFLPIHHSPATLSNVYREAATEDEITCPADIYRTLEQMERAASPSVEIKSILKNKHFVEKESRSAEETLNASYLKRTSKEEGKEESNPVDILGDIVEHKNDPDVAPATIVLPSQQKKKVSRFRQQRP